MNTFMNQLKNDTNFGRTANGALTHKTTNSAVYDMFALGGAYRKRSEEDVILLFKNALEEDTSLALKCLFYLRDCRGGQGERRFFRICFKWLAESHTDTARRLMDYVAEYGRWDDLIYTAIGTPLEKEMADRVFKQLRLDVSCKTPSLLGKWMPSENASSATTKAAANTLRKRFGLSHKTYRKTLSTLRKKINVVERLMSANEWDKIEFDKIPSKAGLIYKNAFARRDIIAKKYEAFAKDESTKVNAKTLYPYDVVAKALEKVSPWTGESAASATDRKMIEKYWDNLPDYFNGKDCSMMCVVDTSGSMHGNEASAPINVAISLGMYCAERIGGPFKNHYISFSSRPQLIDIKGVDFVDKVARIYKTNLCQNTDINGVFNLLRNTALQDGVRKEDIPKTIVIISDMDIDYMSEGRGWTHNNSATEMERIRIQWAADGLELPKLVYWNVRANNDNILDAGPNVSYVSGASPVIFEQVLSGKTGYELMLDKLMSSRYEQIK